MHKIVIKETHSGNPECVFLLKMENDFDNCTIFIFSINADIGSAFQLNEKILGKLIVNNHRELSCVGVGMTSGVHVLPMAGSLLSIVDFILNHFQHRTVETIRRTFGEIAVCFSDGLVNSVEYVQSVDSFFHF